MVPRRAKEGEVGPELAMESAYALIEARLPGEVRETPEEDTFVWEAESQVSKQTAIIAGPWCARTPPRRSPRAPAFPLRVLLYVLFCTYVSSKFSGLF